MVVSFAFTLCTFADNILTGPRQIRSVRIPKKGTAYSTIIKCFSLPGGPPSKECGSAHDSLPMMLVLKLVNQKVNMSKAERIRRSLHALNPMM